MKKYLAGILSLVCLTVAGCDTEVPLEGIQDQLLSTKTLCVLTGGTYDSETSLCQCGTSVCGEGVNCRVSVENGEYSLSCGGVPYTFLTEGPCTMRGVEVCTDRIDKSGVSVGYYTKCGDDNQWAEEQRCNNGYSCKIYEFKTNIMSSQCGDCQNDGDKCIAGRKLNDTAQGSN